MRIIIIFLLALLLVSCSGNKQRNDTVSLSGIQRNESVKYAQWFDIESVTGGSIVTVFNPWKKNKVLNRYFLYKDSTSVDSFPSGVTALKIPVKKIAVTSLDNIGFLSELSALHNIVAVSDGSRIFNRKIKNNIDAGIIANMGPAVDIDVEKLIMSSSSAVFGTVFDGGGHKSEIAEKTGITFLTNIGWMETTPLGRAEWVKFVAVFLDKASLADSIFREIENNYLMIKGNLKNMENKPVVLMGAPYKGTWYVPGGKSFKSALLSDAGAVYQWRADSSSGSVALSFEKVFLSQGNADVWLEVPFRSLTEMKAVDERFSGFSAFRSGRVYNNFGRADGYANDYWETGMCRPDLLIHDLAVIFYPDKYSGKLLYYKKLIK